MDSMRSVQNGKHRPSSRVRREPTIQGREEGNETVTNCHGSSRVRREPTIQGAGMGLDIKTDKSTDRVSAQELKNAVDTLMANIEFQSIDKPICSIVLTSSVPDEGKTTTTWNLAKSLSSAGHSVLVVECDMRRRSIATVIGKHPKIGLHSVITGKAKLSDAVVLTDEDNVWFLDAESGIPNPNGLLSSAKMRDFISEAELRYDYVLFDTPPVTTFVDAAQLASICDATVLVFRGGKPRRSEFIEAYEQLKAANANVIGICATFSKMKSRSSYYYYYKSRKK